MNDDELAATIQKMLSQFNTVGDVCQVLDLARSELDDICRRKYAMSLDDAERKFNAQGRAAIHAAQFEAALEGDRQMLLALGREYLGQGEEQREDEVSKETALDRITSRIAAKGGKPAAKD